MKANGLGWLAAVSLLVAPAHAAVKMIFALPIAPGGPGSGPWKIAEWPDDDCKSCAQKADDNALADRVRQAILSGEFGDVNLSTATIHVLPKHPFGPDTVTATASELHELVKGCTVGAHGMLKRNVTDYNESSYGVGLDCPGDKNRRWLSINFVNGSLAHIYYLPEDPIWALPG
jgi:hypothetical protein